jgi:hypothetical protein
MKSEHEPLELIRRYIDGTASDQDRQAIQEQLRQDPTTRRLFARYANIDATLSSGSIALREPVRSPRSVGKDWHSWRPLTAAAAGIVLGICCTSLVFAYSKPTAPGVASKLLPFADASFESGTQVPSLGIPVRAGAWGGDFSRVVAAENGITPKQGQRMLRFLRSDNELPTQEERSYVGSAAQVIDMRPLRAEFGGSEQLVEVSAQFNAIETPPGVTNEFAVKTALFHGDIADAPQLWGDHQASLSRSDRCVVADSNVTTWQRVSVPVVVPPDVDFMVIECAVVIKKPKPEHGAAEFSGHYVDQVEVRLGGSANAWSVAHNPK